MTCQRDVGSLPAAHVTSPPEVLLSPLPWVYGLWGWKGGEGGNFVLILSFSDNVRNLFSFVRECGVLYQDVSHGNVVIYHSNFNSRFFVIIISSVC